MVTNPRIVVDLIGGDGGLLISNVPVLYGNIENIYGINADWFSILIKTKSKYNEYMVKDDHEGQNGQLISFDSYIAKYSEEVRLKIKIGYAPNYIERMHGFIHEIAFINGSSGEMMKISGGDICYFLNKTYTGDYMLQRDANWNKWNNAKKKEYAFRDQPRIKVLSAILGLRGPNTIAAYLSKSKQQIFNVTPFSVGNLNFEAGDQYRVYTSHFGFKVYVLNTIVSSNEPIYGETKAKKLELANPDAAHYYQINNQTLLEVLDDICFKSGWTATLLPAKNSMDSQPVLVITDNWEKRKANDYKKTLSTSINDDEESWVKFTKLTHFDDGLKLGINYWDWQYAVNTGTKLDNQIKNCQRGKAHWIGNDKTDIAIQAYIDYENVNLEAANRRAYIAINRLVTQRITAQGGMDPDPDIFPGDEVYFKGYEYPFEGQYMITSTTFNVGQKGMSMQFSARLPDMIVTKDISEVKKDPINKILVGKWAD